MTDREQRAAAKQFAEYWKDKGYEKGESQAFWLSLLRDILGVEHPEQFISFEEQVHLDHTSFIDGHISATKVLIEQKSVDKDLNKAIKQSDGSLLTPFAQAKRYITELPLSQHPRWVVTCNFKEFYVYDMERPGGDPEIIKLEDLPKEYYRLEFLVKTGDEHLAKEMEVSIAAGVTTKFIQSILGDDVRIVRVMPNTPALVLEGMSGVAGGKKATKEDVDFVVKFLSNIGKAIQVDESQIDIVTAISGSGPAFYYKVINEIARAGEKMGMDYDKALTLSIQTAIGSAKMLLNSDKSAEDLIASVATKGGCTRVGVDYLDEVNSADMFYNLIEKTAQKANALGK